MVHVTRPRDSRLLSRNLSLVPGRALRRLGANAPALVADDYTAQRNAVDSIAHSLAQLGVADDECEDYLSGGLLALRGWAGIVRQIEERPDRVPARDLTVTLRGYLAVRLLFERAALDEAARQLSFGGHCSALRDSLRTSAPVALPPTAIERAWPLFHVAQLCGLDPSIVEQWTPARVRARIRAAAGRRRALPPHPHQGIRTGDPLSPVRRTRAPQTTVASGVGRVSGDFLHRRAWRNRFAAISRRLNLLARR